jgi:hypothetical protein
MAILLLSGCKKQVTSEKGNLEPREALLEEGWVDLFDGKTFKGWHTYLKDTISSQWKIENGVMFYEPDPEKNQGVNNLITDKKYTDFELALEFKISIDGNSGVFYGILEDERYVVPYMTAPEVQIRDYTNIPDFNDKKQMSGAIFGIVGPDRDLSRKTGEWNSFLIRIDHLKNEGSVTLNGEQVISFPVKGKEWEQLVSHSKFKDWENFGIHESGHIGLQDHAHGVWFRNIRIRELNSNPSE